MKLILDEIITDLKQRLESDKSIRNKVWLKNAISNLKNYKGETEQKPV